MSISSRMEGDVCVVVFEETKMLDEAVINEVDEGLERIADEHKGGKLLIDFNRVTFMSSAMLGKIVFLEKKCRKESTDLRLCSINANIMEAIEMLKLDKILKIYPTLSDALIAFEQG